MQVGDTVLLVEQNAPRGHWSTGIIEKVHPGSDSLVRVVDVRTKDGMYRRAIHTLCLLEDIRKETDEPSKTD